MPYSIEIDHAEFERNAAVHIREVFAQALPRIAERVVEPIRKVVEQAIRSSPEAEALLGGDLQSLFGVAEPGPVVENIIKAVVNSVQVSSRAPAGESLGAIVVEILREDMSDVLGVDGGSYLSHSILRNTEILVPWLSWLLMEGDRLVVTDFEVNTAKPRAASRTGSAIMIQLRKRSARGFQVPSEYSGTVDDNWLTRCLAEAAEPIADILARAVQEGP